MRKITVYIDESGTLPDPADHVVIIAAVGVESLANVDLLLKRAKKKTPLRKPRGELKFYTAGDKTKQLFFELLAEENISVCTLIVDKEGKKIPDTPLHYSILCWLLLSDVLSLIPQSGLFIFDRHFSKQTDIAAFNALIRQQLGKEIAIQHVESISDKRVNIADMVAGATLAKETKKNTQFYRIIETKVVSRKKVKWSEIKQRFLATKKLA